METQKLLARALKFESLSAEEGVYLFENAPTTDLMFVANELRKIQVPGNKVTWIIDRNANTTNVCTANCKFCNFFRIPGHKEAYITSIEEYTKKIEETLKYGGEQLLLQGGHHPDLGLKFYCDLFRELKKKFPVIKLHALGPPEIAHISKLEGKSHKEVLEQLESGQLDIIIGTHQLVNKSVKFKDLGLLIVDEEQKFGVAVKEKLKTLKDNVDVLTLTATPIPRTLQFSLMAARDLSVITTPPPNRYPIDSQVIRLSETIIRDAIHYEIQRSGQVYFIHNRIENIKEVAGLIQRLVPDAKIRVGHGQLEGRKLERLMLDFMGGEFDVLVSTTIVESGLDVPNANTILINNANNFGLSDLHQMRGRVGRSNKKAFCYFITPDFHAMTDDARKRISALEQYTALGSGFNIAMKDLEIRGAGDLLGGEQSGFINDIGFETYQKILNEAIEELKESEFKNLFKEEINNKQFVKEVTLDTDFSLMFPDDFVNNITERLSLYTQLNTLKSETELEVFDRDLTDRFGALPIQVVDLLDSVRIKWLATKLGFDKIVMKQGKLIGYFVRDQNSLFYQSDHFTRILNYVQANPKLCSIKEKQMRQGLRLLISFKNINTVQEGLKSLKPILDYN